MRYSFATISTVLALILSLAKADKAPECLDSPAYSIARADFDNDSVHGVIEFATAVNGTVKVHLDVTGLPKEGGPFYYHIHKYPVDEEYARQNGLGLCEETGTHFNPYNAPAIECDSWDDDSMCQVGDLSGKHGWFNSTCVEFEYYDPYISLNPANKAYIGGTSVNFHFANMTRIICGNIEMVSSSVMNDYEEEDAADAEENEEAEEMESEDSDEDHILSDNDEDDDDEGALFSFDDQSFEAKKHVYFKNDSSAYANDSSIYANGSKLNGDEDSTTSYHDAGNNLFENLKKDFPIWVYAAAALIALF
ncbi:unnamed protein product [[Candida] boidinii]|nr:antioxidant activity protein [[Candida] boidinii]GMF07097.1 unnamed protein product [[Candida] boidinii]